MVKKHPKKRAYEKLPKDTPAFFCANCGAVSLDPERICKVQGKGTRRDWCGIPDHNPPRLCQNRVNNLRWVCGKCNKVSVNAELLCDPRELPKP